jgi:hypothetical protein
MSRVKAIGMAVAEATRHVKTDSHSERTYHREDFCVECGWAFNWWPGGGAEVAQTRRAEHVGQVFLDALNRLTDETDEDES